MAMCAYTCTHIHTHALTHTPSKERPMKHALGGEEEEEKK